MAIPTMTPETTATHRRIRAGRSSTRGITSPSGDIRAMGPGRSSSTSAFQKIRETVRSEGHLSAAVRPFQQLTADLVLWLTLILLFLAFRVTLLLVFRGEISETPGS